MKNIEVRCTMTGFGHRNQLEKCFYFIISDFERFFDSANIDIDLDSFDYFTNYDESYSGIRFMGFVTAEKNDSFFKQPLETISNNFRELIMSFTVYVSTVDKTLPTDNLQTYFFTNGSQKTADEINSKYLKKALRIVGIEKQNIEKEHHENLLQEIENYLLHDMQCLLNNNSFLREICQNPANNETADFDFDDVPESASDPFFRKFFS